MSRYYRRSALPLGLSKNLLLILILPPILFRHFQKFSKLLHPLRLQFPCIKNLPIRLHPVQHIVLLNPMLRRIPMIALNKSHHLLIPLHPPFLLCHSQILLPIMSSTSLFTCNHFQIYTCPIFQETICHT